MFPRAVSEEYKYKGYRRTIQVDLFAQETLRHSSVTAFIRSYNIKSTISCCLPRSSNHTTNISTLTNPYNMTPNNQNTKVHTNTDSQLASRGIPAALLKLVDAPTVQALETCLEEVIGDGSRDSQVIWKAQYVSTAEEKEDPVAAGVAVEVSVKWNDAEGFEQVRKYSVNKAD
jgi:hypothetical protein